jgi:hypothetical protein
MLRQTGISTCHLQPVTYHLQPTAYNLPYRLPERSNSFMLCSISSRAESDAERMP